MSKEIKVTDKRMFTPEGELREEYRAMMENATASAALAQEIQEAQEPEPPGAATPAPTLATPSQAPEPVVSGRAAAPPLGPEARLDLPSSTPPELGGPSFYDLAALLAQQATVYLGDMALPGGQSIEDPEEARMYIDLLDVLRQKTLGNLTAQESTFLEDLLYQLRVRYVQKSR